MECHECEGPLPEDARADTEYCSNACRQRAYRRRKATLRRYGSWENALVEIAADMEARVTDDQPESRNA